MILVTGGTGFIGPHVVRSLHELGEQCVILSRGAGSAPDSLADLPVIMERGDIADLESLREIGRRHPISGIVQLAGYQAWLPGSAPAVEATRIALDGLLNIVQVGQEWEVSRIGVASTIGVYGGLEVEGALSEDLPVLLSAPHPIPRSKKINELLGEQLAETTGLNIVNYRIAGIWGPLGHQDPFIAAPALVHAAAEGTEPDLSGLTMPAYAETALDLCYVRDTGRGIALLQLADRLQHRTYNVASGRATTNAEIIAAIKDLVPDARVELPSGEVDPPQWLNISRIHLDTGYVPEYDAERAVADYLGWLRDGHAS